MADFPEKPGRVGRRLGRLVPTASEFKSAFALPLLALEKARNNQDLIRALATLATTASQEERIRALEQLGVWQARKFVEPQRTGKLARARGVAAELLNVSWVKEHLSSTPYLGLLPVPPWMPACSRLDYVAEIVGLADEFRKNGRGFGLGSPANPPIEWEGKRITDLELIQTWAILQSASHLFGTFATERALLFSLRYDAKTMAEFEAVFSYPLRPAVESLLQRTSMYSFVGALMAWRATRGLEDAIGQCVRSCAAAYLDRNRYEHQREVFRRIRQLASLRLQGTTGVSSAVLPGLDEDAVLGDLMPADGVVFRPFDKHTTPLIHLIDAVDEYQYATYFTGDRASSIVLNHLREFKRWWWAAKDTGLSVVERVERLFSRPGDWPSLEPAELKLVGKLVVGIRRDHWYDEAKAWWNDGKPWAGPSNNFFLSHAPRSAAGTLSLYGDADTNPITVHHILTRLSEQSEQAFATPPNQAFWRSLAVFVGQLLARRLVRPRRLLIDPIEGNDDRIGYVVLAERRSTAVERLGQLLERLKDVDRVRELRTVAAYMTTLDEDPSSRWVVFLGKVRCFHLTPDGEIGDEDGDLDGVIGRVALNGTQWDLLEVKGGNDTPGKQSRKTAAWFGIDASAVETKVMPGARLGIVRVGPEAEAHAEHS